MAKRIEGITIEIDGNTTGLSTALKGVNSNISSANSELKKLDSLLKLNPGNTELVAQKQQVLSEAIKNTTDKLSQLKAQQESVNKSFAEGKIDEKTYRDFNREIVKTEGDLKTLNTRLNETDKTANKVNFDDVTKSLSKLGEKAGQVALEIGKVAVKATTALATALTAVVGKSIQMSGELEQQLGGAEAVFKDYADTAIKESNKAATAMGLSSNEYLATINKMGSLMQGSGMSIEKSLDLSSKAMQRAADVASIMGIDTSAAMDSIAGAAKGNFTMMDNLGVAMNATSIEAYALSKGITESYSNMDQATKVGLAMEMFLEKTTYAMGNYTKENKTFAGSFKTLTANFQNFMSGAGEIQPVIDSVLSFTDILIEKIAEMMPKIVEGLVELGNQIVSKLPEIIQSLIPVLMNSIPEFIEMGATLLKSLVDGIKSNIKLIISSIMEVVMTISKTLLSMLPEILQLGILIILELVNGLVQELPTLIPQIINTVILIAETLIDNLDLIIMAGIDLILALAFGLIDAIPQLVEKLPTIITKIVLALTSPEMIMKLIEAAIILVIALAKAMISSIPTVLTFIPKLLGELVKGFTDRLGSIWDIGKNLVKGIWEGISGAFTWIKDKIKGWVGNVINFIKKLFGIASPSKIMEKQVGLNLGLGIAKGIDDSVGKVQDAMGRLTTGVTASVNPIINPTANSNPLILNIENFNNTRETDVQALMEEAEFYRKNTATAVGGR